TRLIRLWSGLNYLMLWAWFSLAGCVCLSCSSVGPHTIGPAKAATCIKLKQLLNHRVRSVTRRAAAMRPHQAATSGNVAAVSSRSQGLGHCLVWSAPCCRRGWPGRSRAGHTGVDPCLAEGEPSTGHQLPLCLGGNKKTRGTR
uniref:Secreted protein n=1 Tax=Felis catus TaxID=9685 RepID=A0ABI8AMW0_FELCA